MHVHISERRWSYDHAETKRNVAVLRTNYLQSHTEKNGVLSKPMGRVYHKSIFPFIEARTTITIRIVSVESLDHPRKAGPDVREENHSCEVAPNLQNIIIAHTPAKQAHPFSDDGTLENLEYTGDTKNT